MSASLREKKHLLLQEAPIVISVYFTTIGNFGFDNSLIALYAMRIFLRLECELSWHPVVFPARFLPEGKQRLAGLSLSKERSYMLPEFQQAYWEKHFRKPDWYHQLEYELTNYVFTMVHDDPQVKAWRHQVYSLAGEMLAHGEIPLANTGPNLDAERQPLDTVVLHHTEEDPHISLAKLNAIGLLRQYGFQYLENNVLGRAVRGEPIWSGHFRQKQMVFFAYHWLIRPDGTCERLLEDHALGWHAGNWAINTRSVGIALSGNYEHATPPAAQLMATAQLIRTHYPAIAPARILGHCEIRPELTCPGDHFLSEWKTTILQEITSKR